MSLRPQPNKIKVCLVAISLGQGGADRSCALLSEMLSEQGFEVHLAILNDQLGFSYDAKLLNLGKLKKGQDSFLKRFFRIKKLKRYLQKEGITHVIDHRPKNNYKRELFYKNYVYKGLQAIYVVHSFKTETYFGEEPAKMKELYDRNLKTVTVSEAIQNKLKTDLGLDNTQCIYNPFDTIWKEKSEEVIYPLKQPFILSYGRIDDDVKDFSFLIRSYHHSELWKEGLRLVIMGEGKDENKLKTLVEELALTEYIEFLPFAANPFPYISQAHMVALTSKWEGFPMVLVESLSLGIPVVSLDINSGPSEIINHRKNGLLVTEREFPAFAGAMRELFENQSLYATCKENAQASVSQFSKEVIAAAWTKLLKNE
jgi:glycosyltransferase involved in cell wall biosynthesis